jgi:predicted porin
MNKKLIALAVAGACVAPSAIAQTTNPVTLYGLVYATFESVEATGGPVPLVRRNRVADQSSLFGIRGTEDLGAGLKAFFQLETSFKPDQNDSVFAARNSGVGLQGGWGSFLLGRWDVPMKVSAGAVDVFGDRTIAGYQAGMLGSGVGGLNPSGSAASAPAATGGFDGFDRRDQNVVQYWSPSWAGVAIRLSYAANETRTATTNPRAVGASLTYTGGPVYVGVAYDEMKDFRPGFAFTAPVAIPTTAVLPKQRAVAAFGSFTFGPVKLGALYDKIKRDGPAGLTSAQLTTAGTVTGFSEQKAWMGNVAFTFGNSVLLYQFTKAQDGGPRFVTSATVLGRVEPSCKVNAAGYRYNFSRRTFFIGQYVKVDNNDQSYCNFGSNRLGITAGQDLRGISLGLSHTF